MDWTKDAITFASGLLLGAMSGFVWPRLRDRISEKKARVGKAERKAQMMGHLDAIATDVMVAVQVEPHGIQSKDKWVSRLQDMAKQYNDILGPIARCVERISYKIEGSEFDHANPSSSPYCCDQVEEDFALLRLCILPMVAKELGWDSRMIEKEEKQLLRKLWENFQEIGPFPPLHHPDPDLWKEDVRDPTRGTMVRAMEGLRLQD